MTESTPEFFALQAAVAGRYSLVAEIGRGGMGIVFAARDVALDRPVAIKMLPPGLAPSDDFRRRFLREARTAASLSHPHIVPIHAVEECDGLVFFVMTLVDGESLGARVRRTGPLAPREAMRVVQEVAWALGHAHARGVVHRDVKPDNILLERDGDRALVTDFGIAHAAEHDTPVDGVTLGTPAYMSPEQGRGEEPDARSDVYALGVTAWMAAAGGLPFPGPGPQAFLMQHATVPPPSLGSACPALSPAFARAIDQCLAKTPSARWSSAEALAGAVAAELSRLPTAPAPVRAFLREWDRAGSEVAMAGTAAVVSAALSATLAAIPGNSLDRGILTWIYLVIAVVTGTLAFSRVGQLAAHARTLREAGFDQRALPLAQRLEGMQRREETQAALGAPPGRGHLVSVAVTAMALAGVALWGLFQDVSELEAVLLATTTVVLPTIAIRSLWRRWALRGEDGFWTRLASGRFGRLFFRLAGVGLRRTALPPSSSAHDPTVAVAGAQARAAFAALPAGARDALRDVPALIDRLEADAMSLREAASPRAADRLASAMAAVEMLRLDLIRLGAAQAGDVELTAAIERARDIGLRVEAIIEADLG